MGEVHPLGMVQRPLQPVADNSLLDRASLPDQSFDLLLESRVDLIVGKGTETVASALEVDEAGSAPELAYTTPTQPPTSLVSFMRLLDFLLSLYHYIS